MATIEGLNRRHLDIAKLYEEHKDLIISIQQQALNELIPLLTEELNLDQNGLDKVNTFLNDRVTVFRFCRRAKFSIPHSLTLLHATLTYRLTTSLSSPHPILTLESPLYLSLPLFYFHPSLVDKFGRPCAILNLSLVARSEDGGLEGLKEFTRVGWEMGRRWLSDLSSSANKGKGKEKEHSSDDEPEVKVQMVVIVDLLGAGMSNLEFELLPFFMDLLKNHFPGMVGAIFVLNYGWMYAGMWQIARRVLPNTALERILFPTKEDLLKFFDEEHLLVEHGGTLSYSYSSSNPILEKYGGQISALASSAAYPSPSPSPIPSRTQSTDSLEDIYHQAASGRSSSSNLSSLGAGPGTISRRPSGLSMTTLKSRSGLEMTEKNSSGTTAGWRSPGETGGSLLKRVTSFAELQERLRETQKAIESDSSGSEDELDDLNQTVTLVNQVILKGGKEWSVEREIAAREYARQVGESLEGGTSGTEDDDGGMEADDEEATTTEGGEASNDTTPRSSRFSSTAPSRDISRSVSRDTSPNGTITGNRKKEGETFTTRAVRVSKNSSQMSPYNVSNPYYGYPAFVNSTSLDSSGIPRPHFQRRRKRDLARTLTYLAVLRFLALNRQIKRRISRIVATILRLGLIWGKESNEKKKPKVRWGEGVVVKPQESRIREPVKVDIRIVYALVVLLVLRTSFGSRLVVNSTKKILPTRILEGVNNVILKVVTVSPGTVLRTESGGLRQRDFLKGLLGMSGGKN